jgi:raffinose/stachyose/melibiose transport system substrate-binding protein
MRRTVALVAVVAAVSTTAAACSRFTSSSTPSGSNQISFWVPDKGAGTPGLKPALAAFTKQTGIKVKLYEYPNDDVSHSLQHAIGTKTFPDAFQFWTGIGLSQPFLEAKAAAPLSSFYTQLGWNTSLLNSGVSLATFSGQKLAVPYNVHGMGIVYRKDLFAKAHITAVPATMDEFTADMNKLKAAGITPLSFAGSQPWDTMRLLDSLLETECGASTFNALRDLQMNWSKTSCAAAGYNLLGTWIKDGYLAKGFMALNPSSNAMYTAMFQDKAAMTIDGDWSVTTLQQGKQDLSDWGIFPFPTGTGQLYGFTESLWISSKSSHKAQAAKLINYLVSAPVQKKYFNELGATVSPTIGVTPPASLNSYSTAWYKLFNSGNSNTMYQPSDQAFPPDIVTAYELQMQKVELGQQNGTTAVANLQKAIDTYKASNN